MLFLGPEGWPVWFSSREDIPKGTEMFKYFSIAIEKKVLSRSRERWTFPLVYLLLNTWLLQMNKNRLHRSHFKIRVPIFNFQNSFILSTEFIKHKSNYMMLSSNKNMGKKSLGQNYYFHSFQMSDNQVI